MPERTENTPDPAPYFTAIEEAGNRLASTAPDGHGDVVRDLVIGLHRWLATDERPAVRVSAALAARSMLVDALGALGDVEPLTAVQTAREVVEAAAGALEATIARFQDPGKPEEGSTKLEEPSDVMDAPVDQAADDARQVLDSIDEHGTKWVPDLNTPREQMASYQHGRLRGALTRLVIATENRRR